VSAAGVDQAGYARQYSYAEERATARMRQRLTMAGCVSAEATAGSLSRALRGWKPGRDAVALVQTMAGVDEDTARAAVAAWLAGIDEHARALRSLAQSHGIYTPEGRPIMRAAARLDEHRTAIEESLRGVAS